MRRFLFLLLGVVAMTTFSCVDRYEEVEVRKSVIPHTFAEDLCIVNKFMVIDTVNYSYSVSITDSIILAEGIFEDNLIPIFENIDELNEKVKESIRKGEVTTLLLSTGKGFKSYTVGSSNKLSFKDEKASSNSFVATRGYPSLSFYGGDWNLSSASFEGSDRITSSFSVNYCRGYWRTSFTCYTGASSYGDTFTMYSSGTTNGKINRYWWITNGGQSSYSWNFSAKGPVGGEAAGMVRFADTID